MKLFTNTGLFLFLIQTSGLGGMRPNTLILGNQVLLTSFLFSFTVK